MKQVEEFSDIWFSVNKPDPCTKDNSCPCDEPVLGPGCLDYFFIDRNATYSIKNQKCPLVCTRGDQQFERDPNTEELVPKKDSLGNLIEDCPNCSCAEATACLGDGSVGFI